MTWARTSSRRCARSCTRYEACRRLTKPRQPLSSENRGSGVGGGAAGAPKCVISAATCRAFRLPAAIARAPERAVPRVLRRAHDDEVRAVALREPALADHLIARRAVAALRDRRDPARSRQAPKRYHWKIYDDRYRTQDEERAVRLRSDACRALHELRAQSEVACLLVRVHAAQGRGRDWRQAGVTSSWPRVARSDSTRRSSDQPPCVRRGRSRS